MTFTLLQIPNEKAKQICQFSIKNCSSKYTTRQLRYSSACHDPAREIIADFHSIVVAVVCTVVLI